MKKAKKSKTDNESSFRKIKHVAPPRAILLSSRSNWRAFTEDKYSSTFCHATIYRTSALVPPPPSVPLPSSSFSVSLLLRLLFRREINISRRGVQSSPSDEKRKRQAHQARSRQCSQLPR